jgi:hypothetical protein
MSAADPAKRKKQERTLFVPFTAQERRKRQTASQKASQARRDAELRALFGDKPLAVFPPTLSSKGMVCEMFILGESAREITQMACKYLAPSPEAGKALGCRLIRLILCLERHRGRSLVTSGSKHRNDKFKLKRRLALLIAKGCPAPYLNPKLAPSSGQYYERMLAELQALETAFATKLGIPKGEEEEI